jgi:hypothetical protein
MLASITNNVKNRFSSQGNGLLDESIFSTNINAEKITIEYSYNLLLPKVGNLQKCNYGFS